MKHPICLIAALLLCASAYGQTVRTLAYNISNNVVIGATNTNALTWSNSFAWSTNTLAAATRTNLALPWSGLTNSNASTFRSALGLLGSWLTNTNGATDFMDQLFVSSGYTFSEWIANVAISSKSFSIADADTSNSALSYNSADADGSRWVVIEPQELRTSLQLSLSALTNTSNVTVMRALAGSTNTNEPYSGTVALTNTNVLTFSNGVLLRIQ